MTNVPRQKGDVPGTIKHGQHLIAVPDNMLAVTVDSSSKHALSRRTVQGLSKVPAVHCNIPKAMGQHRNPE